MADKSEGVTPERLDRNMQVPAPAGLAALQWHCPKQPPFHLAGFAWFGTDRIYRRMPVRPVEKLPDAVDQLANATAGGQIRFRTDSTQVAVRVRLSGLANMTHMPATGQCGFDVYLGEPNRQVYYYTTKYDRTQQSYEILLCDLERGPTYSITLNFPLYQGVESVEVGLEPGSTILPPLPYASDRRVILYGTSITQGGCASRPGMCYSNILSRRINLEFINLGFSGNGKGEPEVARTVAEIDAACFVLDFAQNNETVESLRAVYGPFMETLRAKHPETPILAVTPIYAAREAFGEAPPARLEPMRELIRQVAAARIAKGDGHLQIVEGTDLLGPAQGAGLVDGTHPNDLGFEWMAEGFATRLRKVLRLR